MLVTGGTNGLGAAALNQVRGVRRSACTGARAEQSCRLHASTVRAHSASTAAGGDAPGGRAPGQGDPGGPLRQEGGREGGHAHRRGHLHRRLHRRRRLHHLVVFLSGVARAARR